MQRHNEAEDAVAPGVVTMFSVTGLIKIAVIAVGVAVAGVISGEVWGYVVAALAIVIGSALCFNLARDASEDARAWKRRRPTGRSKR